MLILQWRGHNSPSMQKIRASPGSHTVCERDHAKQTSKLSGNLQNLVKIYVMTEADFGRKFDETGFLLGGHSGCRVKQGTSMCLETDTPSKELLITQIVIHTINLLTCWLFGYFTGHCGVCPSQKHIILYNVILPSSLISTHLIN